MAEIYPGKLAKTKIVRNSKTKEDKTTIQVAGEFRRKKETNNALFKNRAHLTE